MGARGKSDDDKFSTFGGGNTDGHTSDATEYLLAFSGPPPLTMLSAYSYLAIHEQIAQEVLVYTTRLQLQSKSRSNLRLIDKRKSQTP